MALNISKSGSKKSKNVFFTTFAILAFVVSPFYSMVADQVASAASSTTTYDFDDYTGGTSWGADWTFTSTVEAGTDSNLCGASANCVKFSTTGGQDKATYTAPAGKVITKMTMIIKSDETSGAINTSIRINPNGSSESSSSFDSDYDALLPGRTFQVADDVRSLELASGKGYTGYSPVNGIADRDAYIDDVVIELADEQLAPASGTRYVETTGSDIDNVCTVETSPCATIQHAVDKANPGEIVEVAAGIYSESVSITKSLTLKGAQAGVDPRPSINSARAVDGSAESIVVAQKSKKVFDIRADGVTIDGFKVKQSGGTGSADAIKADASQANLSIVNNIVTEVTDEAIQLEAGSNYDVSQNYILNPVGDGITFSTYTPPKGTNLSIKNNDITGSQSAYGSIYLYGANNVTVSGNVINTRSSGIASGSDGLPASHITITGNTITTELHTAYSATAIGISVDGNSEDVKISGNSIRQEGVVSSAESVYPDRFSLIRVGVATNANPLNIVVENNNLSRITSRNYLYVNSGVTNGVAAQNNWWNSQDDPMPRIQDNTQGVVTSSPWLCEPYTGQASPRTAQLVNGSYTCAVAPDAPTDLKVYRGHNSDSDNLLTVNSDGNIYTNTTKIRIAWTPSATTGVDGYCLRVTTTEEDECHRIIDPSQLVNGEVYYDANMTPGYNPYGYSVSAMKDGMKSAETYRPAVILDQVKPATPTITSPADGKFISSLPIDNEWTKVTTGSDGETEVSGVDHYQIAYHYADGHTFGGTNTCAGDASVPAVSADHFVGCRDVSGTSRDHEPADWEQGKVTIWVRAVDKAGNVSSWSEPVHYYYDSTQPTAHLDELDGDLSGVVNITGYVSDDVGLSHYNLSIYPGDVNLDDGAPHNGDRIELGDGWVKDGRTNEGGERVDVERLLDTTKLENGEYQIRLGAADKADLKGIVGESVAIIRIVVDNPSERVVSDQGGGSVNTGTGQEEGIFPNSLVPDSNEVAILGDADPADGSDTSGEIPSDGVTDTTIHGAEDNNGETEGDSKANGNGFAWYWWLVIAAIIAGLWWLLAGRRRKSGDAADL